MLPGHSQWNDETKQQTRGTKFEAGASSICIYCFVIIHAGPTTIKGGLETAEQLEAK